jgi:hypothetical protein
VHRAGTEAASPLPYQWWWRPYQPHLSPTNDSGGFSLSLSLDHQIWWAGGRSGELHHLELQIRRVGCGSGDLHHLPAVPTSGGAHGRMLQPWMGSVGPWMASTSLSMDFSFFFVFYFINRGGHQTTSEKVRFTMTFVPRRFRCPPRKIKNVRLGKDLCRSELYNLELNEAIISVVNYASLPGSSPYQSNAISIMYQAMMNTATQGRS